MTGPKMKSFCETVMSAFPNIDWKFEGGGSELLNMIATGSIYENFQVKIWWDSSRESGHDGDAEIRYGRSSVYRVTDSDGRYTDGVSVAFACTCIQEELAKMSKAFEVVSLTTKPNTSLYANAVKELKSLSIAIQNLIEDLPITEEEKPDAVELTTAARKRLVPYYGEREVFNHLTSLSFKASAEFLEFVEANTDEQLKNICDHSLATISLMAIPCEVIPRSVDIGCSENVIGYVSRTPVERLEDAPDTVSQLTFEIPVEEVAKFFGRDSIRDEIKRAQSELDFFPYAMPFRLPDESMKYVECIDLDTFFRISSNRIANYFTGEKCFTGEKITEALEAQRHGKDLAEKELSRDYGKLFPWDLPE